jgi:hypothetical protein
LSNFPLADAFSTKGVHMFGVTILSWLGGRVLQFLHLLGIKYQLVEFFADGAWRNPASEPAQWFFGFFETTPRQQPYWCLRNLKCALY